MTAQQSLLFDPAPAPVPKKDGPATPAAPAATSSERRAAAAACRLCPWAEHATQTVFGEGPLDARLVFVGEQPGDVEDTAGRPFVGPAGQLFAQACAEAGIDRDAIYVTNAVKHFKWEPRGKLRLHKKPSVTDIKTCRPWLIEELTYLRPAVVVCLGVTAIYTALQRSMPLKDVRGQMRATSLGPKTFFTSHPSAILRAPDPQMRAAARAAFVADLRQVRALVAA